MSQNGKLMPNLDQQSTKILNLTVLRRIDPYVEEILITAAHVTFYEFNIELSQWSRKDVEGSLFVVKRSTQPRFQFIVMNRRNTDNLVENLLEDFEYEVQGPYLLYRNAAQEVNGIWFYNKRECDEVANFFNRILNAYSKVPQKSKVASTKSDFEELEAVPTMAVMDGPLEPTSSTAAAINDASDDSALANFFSAITMGSGSSAAAHAQPFQSSAAMSAPAPSHPAIVSSPVIPTLQVPPPPLSASTPLMSLLEASESNNNTNRTTNLIKPSSFFIPPSSSARMMPPITTPLPTAPPLNPAVSLQQPYGAPLLQPFPPPTPPPSLTPIPTPPPPNHAPVISREKVKEALSTLVQDNQFMDMVYRAVLNAHHS